MLYCFLACLLISLACLPARLTRSPSSQQFGLLGLRRLRFWLACLLGSLVREVRCSSLNLVCENCAWIAHSRSSLRSHGPCLICLVCLICVTALGSLTRGARFASVNQNLTCLAVFGLLSLLDKKKQIRNSEKSAQKDRFLMAKFEKLLLA